MALSTRRQFVQRTAIVAAGLCGCPGKALAEAGRILELEERSAAPLDAAVVRRLASQIAGHVITPDSADYDAARVIFNRAFDVHPALIVRCAGAPDIARALDFAQGRSLPLAVRAGGHSRAGFGLCDGGIVIDVSGMNRVEVDAGKHVAHAEAGALVRDLDLAAQRFGLATTSGACPTVGIAGLTLGGGEGLLQSLYGAACDNLLSARLMTVDGRQVVASPKSNPDLFWAIRGGGGNFAVAVAFEYQLHPVGEVLSGALTYPADKIPDLLHTFGSFGLAAPDEMVVVAEMLPSEKGPKLLIHVCYFGRPQAGNDLLAPFRSPVKPQADDLRLMSYPEAQSAGFLQKPFAHFQTNFLLPELSGAVIEAITTAIQDAPAPFRVLIVPFAGAITRVPVGDTAFALRRPGHEVDIAGRWDTPAQKAGALQWVEALSGRLRPLASGVYVNQTSETGAEIVRAAYGPNYARLLQIKKKYDPRNVLRLNQNIKPD